MTPSDVTVIAGLVIPSSSPLFLVGVVVHVAAGLACVIVGAAAMLSRKRRGRHSTFGAIYYWSLSVVALSAFALSVVRWAEDYLLFILAALSFASASVGRLAIRRGSFGRFRPHIAGMGASYILLLTAFYVDNGKNLPLWKALPQIAYWLLPSAIGAPIMGYAMLRHPIVKSAV
jgi:uncharacterized membrane protein